MKCGLCLNYFDENAASAVCPHMDMDAVPAPAGGPRIPEDQRALIELAFRTQDQDGLYRMMSHGNAAVRAYATQMSKVLDYCNSPSKWDWNSPLQNQGAADASQIVADAQIDGWETG